MDWKRLGWVAGLLAWLQALEPSVVWGQTPGRPRPGDPPPAETPTLVGTAESCPLDKGCLPVGRDDAGCGPAGRAWLGADYLWWAAKGDRLPPLISTSPPGTPANQAAGLGTSGSP